MTIFGSFSSLREYVSLLKMWDVNNSDLKNTGIASLRKQFKFVQELDDIWLRNSVRREPQFKFSHRNSTS